jgi:molybdenum cofactor cytidylyltransferase
MSPTMRTSAVLLAAGSGSRMGHKPKSLLELNGEPLSHRSARQLLDAGVTQLVVVLGHYAADIEAPLYGLPVHKVYNPDPDLGLVSSQRLGLQAIEASTDAVVMSLADQPLVTTQDIQTLLLSFASSTKDMLFPWINGQPGNPVLLSARARADILAGESDYGCKEWRQSHAAQTLKLPTDNPHFVTDLDRPEDIADFEKQHGMKLQWPPAWTD